MLAIRKYFCNGMHSFGPLGHADYACSLCRADHTGCWQTSTDYRCMIFRIRHLLVLVASNQSSLWPVWNFDLTAVTICRPNPTISRSEDFRNCKGVYSYALLVLEPFMLTIPSDGTLTNIPFNNNPPFHAKKRTHGHLPHVCPTHQLT